MIANSARGLTYEAVKAVADKLVADGKPVGRITYRDILAETGTGSLETIGNHLRRYRLEYVEMVSEDDVDSVELEDLIGPIRNIVVRKVRKVNERRDLEQTGERERAGTQREDLAFAIVQNRTLEGEIASLRERNRDLEERVAGAATLTAALQGKLDEARARYDDLVVRLLPTAPGSPAASSAPPAATRSASTEIAAEVTDLVGDLRQRERRQFAADQSRET